MQPYSGALAQRQLAPAIAAIQFECPKCALTVGAVRVHLSGPMSALVEPMALDTVSVNMQRTLC